MFVKLQVSSFKCVHLFQVFQYPEPFDKQTIEELRKEWAKYFLQIRSSSYISVD